MLNRLDFFFFYEISFSTFSVQNQSFNSLLLTFLKYLGFFQIYLCFSIILLYTSDYTLNQKLDLRSLSTEKG